MKVLPYQKGLSVEYFINDRNNQTERNKWNEELSVTPIRRAETDFPLNQLNGDAFSH